jgi:hypothetical protein
LNLYILYIGAGWVVDRKSGPRYPKCTCFLSRLNTLVRELNESD